MPLTEEGRLSRRRESCKKWQSKNKERVKEYYLIRIGKLPKKERPDRRINDGMTKSQRWYYRDIERGRKKAREAYRRRKERDPSYKRRARLKYTYGLSVDEWTALFESQGKKCAICESGEPGAKSGWNTDHCHSSGKVRFILCAHCNRGLGAFKDSPELLRAAADILEAWKKENEVVDNG